VAEGGDLADVTTAVAELLDGRLLVVDSDGHVLAAAGPAGDELQDSAVTQGSIPRATPTGSTVRALLPEAIASGATLRVPDDVPRLVAPVMGRVGGTGCLVLTVPDGPGDAEVRTLERAALVCAVVLLNERSVAEAEQRLRGELLEDLLDRATLEPERIRSRARLLGLDPDRTNAVVVATQPSDRRATLAAATALAQDLSGVAGEHRGRLVLLLADTTPSEAAALVSRRMGAHVEEPVTAAGAGPAAGPAALAEAHRSAESGLRVLLALDRVGSASSVEDLGMFGILLDRAGREDVDRLVRAALGPLIDYDERRGTDLLATLEAYFRQGGNATRTAAALHVHVNTLYQRLDRVSRLLGRGWAEEDRALQTHLALRLRRVRGALGSHAG
jgi:sugar diacid utilization regulator